MPTASIDASKAYTERASTSASSDVTSRLRRPCHRQLIYAEKTGNSGYTYGQSFKNKTVLAFVDLVMSGIL
jgi:hypothetical protein